MVLVMPKWLFKPGVQWRHKYKHNSTFKRKRKHKDDFFTFPYAFADSYLFDFDIPTCLAQDIKLVENSVKS